MLFLEHPDDQRTLKNGGNSERQQCERRLGPRWVEPAQSGVMIPARRMEDDWRDYCPIVNWRGLHGGCWLSDADADANEQRGARMP